MYAVHDNDLAKNASAMLLLLAFYGIAAAVHSGDAAEDDIGCGFIDIY